MAQSKQAQPQSTLERMEARQEQIFCLIDYVVVKGRVESTSKSGLDKYRTDVQGGNLDSKRVN